MNKRKLILLLSVIFAIMLSIYYDMYYKTISETDKEERTAYEVSVNRMAINEPQQDTVDNCAIL